MKNKIIKILVCLFILIFTLQCSKEPKSIQNQKAHIVKSKFYYSDDAGKTYGDSRKEFKVGETVYMKMNVEVQEKKEKSNWIWVFIIIGTIIGVIVGTLLFPVIGTTLGGVAGAAAGGGAAAAAAAAGAGTVAGAAGGGAAAGLLALVAAISGALGGTAGAGASLAKDELTKPKLDFINCELIIPNITAVDSKYYDGTVITPLKDDMMNITTYPIKIGISKDVEDNSNQEYSFVFQFIPNAESEIPIKLIFDDNIAEQYDKISTIKFIK